MLAASGKAQYDRLKFEWFCRSSIGDRAGTGRPLIDTVSTETVPSGSTKERPKAFPPAGPASDGDAAGAVLDTCTWYSHRSTRDRATRSIESTWTIE